MPIALERFDRVLSLAIRKKFKHYALCPLTKPQRIVTQSPLLQQFAIDHGYFSRPHPLVARVSKERKDSSILFSLLRTFPKTTHLSAISFATLELLAKVLAYRDLTQGEIVLLPTPSSEGILFHPFTVDSVFNLWQGMPAFGLLPKELGIPPLLLFRGTDFSPFSKRGLASLLSDLDPRGPGYFVFQRARKILRTWLQKVAQNGTAARVLGYSLGGSLAAYTYIYENALINTKNPSIAFNPPGVNKKTLADAQALGQSKSRNFVLFINRGDPISKIGNLFGHAYELSCNKALHPLAAHTLFLCGEESVTINKIDVNQENQR